MDTLEIARVCHEVNRAYCQALDDHSQPSWDDAPGWQRQSAVAGVQFHLDNPNATPAASHESWLKQKQEDGWVYGAEKNEEQRTHPCIMPFEGLSTEQQAKDYLFRAVVHALSWHTAGPSVSDTTDEPTEDTGTEREGDAADPPESIQE